MVVNKKEYQIDSIRKILRADNGILLTSDLRKSKIPRAYLALLEKEGEIQRLSRGIYSSAEDLVDEMASIQARYKAAIFSHETALYLLGLTDRTPLRYSLTLPSGYNATSLKASGAKVYFVARGLHQIGLTTVETAHGNNVKSFNLERTICDVLRSRNRIDAQFIHESLKRYIDKKERNLNMLYSYAQKFKIQRIIRNYIEVLL